MKLYIIKFLASTGIGGAGGTGRMDRVLEKSVARYTAHAAEKSAAGSDDRLLVEYILSADRFASLADSGALRNSRLLFAVETDISGISLEACKLLHYLRLKCLMPENACDQKASGTAGGVLAGCTGGIIIDGQSELFTKDLGRRLAFTANLAGCNFPGKPLVEATSDLRNFRVLAGLWNRDLYAAYEKACSLLLEKILAFRFPVQKHPSILAVHASNRKTSNSLALWDMTASHLSDRADIDVVSIRNGQLWDCRGCKYEDCLHFGENGDCFYGGVMVDRVYPAIIRSDVLVLICPNYNDSVSANMMAFINRLTAVFRAHDFSRKRIYAIVVSGYSGGDIVAQQIIGAINMNKNLILPGNFALMVTANDPGEALGLHGIDDQTSDFARRILVG